MTSATLLVCTVGGSHEPIVKAIRQREAGFVCFVCSEDDRATGRSGSALQIEGRGLVIKARPQDDKATLPNIPAQAGLAADAFEVLRVPPDALDQACAAIRGRLRELRARHPGARLIADYTGGTKSMTAALAIAALEEGVELQVVTGSRVDLVKVRSGMEGVFAAPTESLRLERAMAPFRTAWQRYGYAEAAQGFGAIAVPQDEGLRAELFLWRDMSRALDAWDRFDHAAARELLDAYAKRIGPVAAHVLDQIRGLTDGDGARADRREALRLFDLWRNAERRAARGRFDDAVARLYRLLEWTAQWLLRRHLGIDTGNVPADRLPSGFEVRPDADGTIRLGLADAWRLLGHVDAFRPFVAAQLGALRQHVWKRNASLLAHGFEPVSQADWTAFAAWAEHHVLPLLVEQARGAGVKALPEQLPRAVFWQ